jgi:hypothetical protein
VHAAEQALEAEPARGVARVREAVRVQVLVPVRSEGLDQLADQVRMEVS